ncbi:hypothetical protein RIF29_26801 [Crotalaria pallida]|uniref:Uncharacterized protein n=1 Tax=Crotalaria pallida TaxID=3830 RepID=A0AAN9I519_CROPI
MCNDNDETGMHIVRDCPRSKALWVRYGFSRDAWQWVQESTNGVMGGKFLAVIWWAWRWRNMEVLGTEDWNLEQVDFRINALLSDLQCGMPGSDQESCLVREVSWIKPPLHYVKRDWEVSISHVLREVNGCVDVLAKMGVVGGLPLVIYDPPIGIMQTLARDTAVHKNQPSTMLPEKEEVLNAAISRVDVLEQELQATKKRIH